MGSGFGITSCINSDFGAMNVIYQDIHGQAVHTAMPPIAMSDHDRMSGIIFSLI
jgi:hypothetical protein